MQVNYQAQGSGAGIKQFQRHLVDFGASDAAMTDEEMAAVPRGRSVTTDDCQARSLITYNLPDGPSELRLSREAYVGIFLGKITRWNDPAIAKSNPGVKSWGSPKSSRVVRADGSGTTFVFTSHLSAISDEWKAGPGAGKSVNFPAAVAGRGNSWRDRAHQADSGCDWRTVEYGYAVQTKMPMALLKNKSSKYVKVYN